MVPVVREGIVLDGRPDVRPDSGARLAQAEAGVTPGYGVGNHVESPDVIADRQVESRITGRDVVRTEGSGESGCSHTHAVTGDGLDLVVP